MLAVGVTSLALAGTAGASSGSGLLIEGQDACDPATFFDPESGESLCSRTDGSGKRVSFDKLLNRISEKGAHGAWRFAPDNAKVEAGEPVSVTMGRGGEFHTFTRVDAFGPGCVPLVNDLVFGPGATTPPAVCGELVPVPDGSGALAPKPFVEDGVLPFARALAADKLQPGVNMFQCMIHPWMHATVTVE